MSKQVKRGETLIVIETPHGMVPESILNALCKNVSGDKIGKILLFADISPVGLRQRLGEAWPAHGVIDAASLLDVEAHDFIDTLPAWMENLANSFTDQPDFWLTRFSELSVGSTVWFDLLRTSVTQKILAAHSFEKCTIVGREPFVSTIAEMTSSRAIKTTVIRLDGQKGPSWGRLLLRAIALWGHNLISDLTAWWMTRNGARPAPGGLQIFTSFPNNWLHLDNSRERSSLRYTGRLGDISKRNKQASTYLCTLPRHARSRLKSPIVVHHEFIRAKSVNPDMPIIWVETFGTLCDVLFSYFTPNGWLPWFRTWRALIKNSEVRWNDTNIDCLFRESIILGPLVDWPSNRLLERCMKKLLSETSPRNILVPGFEFSEGRAITRSTNKTKTKSLGLQHGANSLPHLWRFSRILDVMQKDRNGGIQSLPNQILVEGEADAEHLQSVGFKAAPENIIGAPRITEEIPKMKVRPLGTQALLLLGDLPGARANENPWWLEWCLSELAKNHPLIIRPHPTVAQETANLLKVMKRTDNVHAELGGIGSLAEEMERIDPIAVIGCITGSTIEVAMRGWPVAIFRTNWLPDMSPYSSLKNSSIFCTRDTNEMLSWLKRLNNDAEFRENYIRSGCRTAHRLVASTATEAATRLALKVT